MSIEIREITTEEDAAACYPIMYALRPELESAEKFARLWRDLSGTGYRLLALFDDGEIRALAGFRINHNIVHGKHMYVDDLVTAERERSSGFGAQLMDRLRDECRRQGCGKLLLDTPMSNSLGHRFYYRQGMFATALRFTQEIK
ncbi:MULTISPECIES: GNAT family N-acetyltransferase [unclassified Beijerinckia]|uniref:GNAT family N-acetyltransferase n=1 Tax=unclassified Beijerinckia TaxID=2638183 RepID=UPI000896531D|nr:MULTISPECIES: GNAT family N-acetyltransferase [unclassified Beijerinckia]MDH7796864.1 GNAT superfamily N-acetyltransferase [Beijerinckia sp. GAS462]SEC62869.1 Acetyltransferase (GNAT) family protein [Beijerinckia sp. 28-YEA-48]